jgi:hypothetical protein
MKHDLEFGFGYPNPGSGAFAEQLNRGQERVEGQLRDNGWARFGLSDLPFPTWLIGDFQHFVRAALDDLPPDPYDPSGQRRRRYGRFLWIPSQDLLIPVCRDIEHLGIFTSYVQGSEFQPEHGDEVRRFAALSEAVMTSRVLRALVAADYRVAVRAGVIPEAAVYLVGIHDQRLEPQGKRKAVITPDVSHRDGEPVTFVHMLDVANITGGWNAVTTLKGVGKHPSDLPRDDLLAKFMLHEPGSGFVVDDRKVGHFVEGVALIDRDLPGNRTTLLIDFCPPKWVVSNEN